MQMKVHIYYGGLSGYRDILPSTEEDYMPIVDLAILDDTRHRNIKVDIEGREIKKIEDMPYYKNVIAFSDDYPSLTESLIESFSNFVFRYEIENLYLQNPPNSIAKRMKQYSGIEYKIYDQKYKVLGMDEIKHLKMDSQRRYWVRIWHNSRFYLPYTTLQRVDITSRVYYCFMEVQV